MIGILLFLSFGFPIHAEEKKNTGKIVVFLLDASGSMKANDSERLAIDSIAQLVYSLPSDYEVGFVAYNSNVVAQQVPVASSKRKKIMSKAEKVVYNGYSNAGAGLEQAVAMLSEEDKEKEKCVVLLSDGEVLMEDKKATKKAKSKYKKATKAAKQAEIKIHVIGLEDEMKDEGNFIFQAANSTGGKTYYTKRALNIQKAIDSILNNELRIKQSTAAIVDADGELEKVSVDIPYTYASKVRILLTSKSSIKNLNTSFQAESANQVNGNRYSLIELNRPSGEKVALSFEGTAGSQVRINVIPEYRVVPVLRVTYKEEVPLEEDAKYYERTAKLSYAFYDMDNQDIQLWKQDYFEHMKLILTDEAGKEELTLNEGILEQEQRVGESAVLEKNIDYSKMPINVIGTGKIEAELEGPSLLPEEKPPYGLITGIGITVLIIVGIIMWVWNKNKRKPLPMPPEDRPEPSKYSYAGKLSIYITRTQSGYDIPPLSYNLFRLPAGRVISLQEILESCNVKEELSGAGTIYFKSGANRNLVITNNSDCTIMRNREILLKKKSYQIPLESKLDITFEDEISELMLQYKDLKPSAMR